MSAGELTRLRPSSRLTTIAVVAALIALVSVTGARAATAPPPLSADTARADITSTYGSGSFGTWTTGAFGLPAYDYTVDEATAPQAAQPELAGSRDAWHQLGNDHVVADAFNHGDTQLWSQDRTYEWMNKADPAHDHFAGGYGYLRLGGRVYSTLYSDRAPGVTITRVFGTGYAERTTVLRGARVDERVYAPFGDDPVLLHDVTITNTSRKPESPSWFEYWDVNPENPLGVVRGTQAPVFDQATDTLSVAQLVDPQDSSPLSIFAAALRGPVRGVDADTQAFFGSGTRALPAAVEADQLTGATAPLNPGGAAGRAMFAFRSPVRLAPGRSVTLRYAYGYGHPAQIAPLVARWRAARDPFRASERAWAAFVPQASFGPRWRWLARELQWDAYMVRSGATYEECAGHHIISQGGYYQYGLDFQGAFRDPLQHVLPMIYSDPSLAREVILYSAGEQPQTLGQVPYARIQNCARFDLGTSDDLDLWLLWTAAEYGLATRDMSFFNTQVPWADGGTGTLWAHLKRAVAHQESQRSLHGLYLAGLTGDWSDLLTEFAHMTESTLVAAQAAYVYPRLAELADERGDPAFAASLRGLAAGLRTAVAAQWVARGWYSRGYSGLLQFGTGAIYGEPQPWAILAGIPSRVQAATLVANIRRYLTGIGAPGGPSPIGSSQSPAADDPGVTEVSPVSAGVGDKHAAYPGGAWYAVDGWLAWALGTLDRELPAARADAWSEFTRDTLAAHATAYPDAWDGILSVDDACRSWYSTDPGECGVGLSTAYDTQIMHQPAYGLFDALQLAGITPTSAGYDITPHLPMTAFSLRFPQIGVAYGRSLARGYVRVATGGVLRMRVAPPPGVDPSRLIAYAGGRRVPAAVQDGLVVFDLPAVAGRAANWALAAARPAHRRPTGRHPHRRATRSRARPRPRAHRA
jgi:hypothetical protein